jgi:osmotically-inducible protein OsmY
MLSQSHPKPDAQVARDVATELWWDARTRNTDVAISVQDGIVTLSGAVPADDAVRAAEDAAQRVWGVRGILNKVVTKKGDPRSTGDLHPAPAALARREPEPDRKLPIRVTPAPGWVILFGTVDSPRERAEIERMLARIPGVVGVVNSLEVRTPAADAVTPDHTTEPALLGRP